MKSVYLEKICKLTGTSKSKTVKIRRKDSKASIRNNNFFMSNFRGEHAGRWPFGHRPIGQSLK